MLAVVVGIAAIVVAGPRQATKKACSAICVLLPDPRRRCAGEKFDRPPGSSQFRRPRDCTDPNADNGTPKAEDPAASDRGQRAKGS